MLSWLLAGLPAAQGGRECACVGYGHLWGSGADRESTQELGSSFRENDTHSLCSAGTYTARLLLRARLSPLVGTQAPRPGFCLKMPIPETTPHPGRDGPSSPQWQRTDGSKWKGVAPWVSFGKEVFVPPRLKAGV